MKIWVDITDRDWIEFLNQRKPDEVNLWQPSGGRRFRASHPGDLEPAFDQQRRVRPEQLHSHEVASTMAGAVQPPYIGKGIVASYLPLTST